MKIKKIEYGIIEFDNGNVLTDHHQQDCCEHVYADFENLQVLTKIGSNSMSSEDLEFDENLFANIELMEGVGFKIKDKNGIELFVSCYDFQNGYYSSDLELVYTKNVNGIKIKEKIDITNCSKSDYS